MNLLFFRNFGVMELVVILVVLLLLFGTRLPSLMRSLGKGVTEFKKGLKEPAEEPKEQLPTGEKEKVRD